MEKTKSEDAGSILTGARHLAHGFVYLVLFRSSGLSTSPIILNPATVEKNGTKPHGFDKDIIPALHAIWYCLHLPRNTLDLLDLSLKTIKYSHKLDQSQTILIMPHESINDDFMTSIAIARRPTIIFAPDDLLEIAEKFRTKCKILLSVALFSKLDQDSLDEYWRQLAALSENRSDKIMLEAPRLLSDVDSGRLLLPAIFSTRQFGATQTKGLYREYAKGDINVLDAYLQLAQVSTLAFLEEEGTTKGEVEDVFNAAFRSELAKFRVPVVVTSCGVPKRHTRNYFGKVSSVEEKTLEMCQPG